MKNIKSEYELANVLGQAFERYANILLNGNVAAFAGLLTDDEVVVSLKVVHGNLVVSEGPDVDGYIAEVGVLEGKVKALEKEVKSLNLLMEEQKPPEETVETWADGFPVIHDEPVNVEIVPISEVQETVKKTKKKSRKRKQK